MTLTSSSTLGCAGIVFSGSQYFLGVAPGDFCRTEQQSSSIPSYEMPFLTGNGELNNLSTTLTLPSLEGSSFLLISEVQYVKHQRWPKPKR
jgi:hypothetical protein